MDGFTRKTPYNLIVLEAKVVNHDDFSRPQEDQRQRGQGLKIL